MAFYTNAKIVRTGLVVYLDAKNPKSYSGTGNTWYDLSGNGNHCVFTVTPAYNSGGYLTFDGSTTYGTITYNSTLNFSNEQTVIFVIRHTYTSGRKNPWNQAYAGFGTWTHENGDNITQYFGNDGNNGSHYIGIGSPSTPRGVWNMMCATRDTLQHIWYINGVSNGPTTNPYGSLAPDGNNILIGTGYTGTWQGDMACVMAYNRRLTATEVYHNFYSLQKRFSL